MSAKSSNFKGVKISLQVHGKQSMMASIRIFAQSFLNTQDK